MLNWCRGHLTRFHDCLLPHQRDFLGSLSPLQSHLGCHDPLTFHDEDTLLTSAIPVLAVFLVALYPRNDAMVATSSTLWFPNATTQHVGVEASILIHVRYESRNVVKSVAEPIYAYKGRS